MKLDIQNTYENDPVQVPYKMLLPSLDRSIRQHTEENEKKAKMEKNTQEKNDKKLRQEGKKISKKLILTL